MDLRLDIPLKSIPMNWEQIFTIDLGKKFTPYPYFTVSAWLWGYFEKKKNIAKAPDLDASNEHIPVW